MAATAASGTLRIITGIAILATMGYAGFLHRSPWIIPLFGVIFTILYVHGKSAQWRLLLASRGVLAVLVSLLIAYPIQAIIAGIVYLVGYGLGALLADRPIEPTLTSFDFWLAGGLLAAAMAVGFVIHGLEGASAAPRGESGLSREMRGILDEAHDLSEQAVTMPVKIFALARRLADHPDRTEAMAAIDGVLADDKNAFVRRVALTAIRFMGQPAPDVVDRRIVRGMQDESAWVRYDAAWAAGVIAGNNAAYAEALKRMIEAASKDAEAKDPGSAAYKALDRVIKSLEIVAERTN